MKIISRPTNVVSWKVRIKFIQHGFIIKLVENGPIHKIFHPKDTEKVLGVDNLDEYNNVSF